MSFFSKLKSKLFKSSVKLEEGLDAIVQDDIASEHLAEDENLIIEAPEAELLLSLSLLPRVQHRPQKNLLFRLSLLRLTSLQK